MRGIAWLQQVTASVVDNQLGGGNGSGQVGLLTGISAAQVIWGFSSMHGRLYEEPVRAVAKRLQCGPQCSIPPARR